MAGYRYAQGLKDISKKVIDEVSIAKKKREQELYGDQKPTNRATRRQKSMAMRKLNIFKVIREEGKQEVHEEMKEIKGKQGLGVKSKSLGMGLGKIGRVDNEEQQPGLILGDEGGEIAELERRYERMVNPTIDQPTVQEYAEGTQNPEDEVLSKSLNQCGYCNIGIHVLE